MPVTEFIWDELNDSYLMETDGAGITTAAYTNELEEFGDLVSQQREGSTSHFHCDGQHSTRQLTNSTQVATDSYIFSAFGESVAASGTTTNSFRFVGARGYYSDDDVPFIYVRARTYSQGSGRWLSEDPMEFFDGPNKYPLRDPVNSVDPSGMFVWHRCRRRRRVCRTAVSCRMRMMYIVCECPRYGTWQQLSETCMQCEPNEEMVERLVEMNCAVRWTSKLPCCPDTAKEAESQGWDKDQPWESALHPHAAACWRKRVDLSCQQCCYNGAGELITTGDSAGTPDYYCPGLGVPTDPARNHQDWDGQPLADCGLDWYFKAGWAPDRGCKAHGKSKRKRR
jgi:RHS repeat-associated protein